MNDLFEALSGATESIASSDSLNELATIASMLIGPIVGKPFDN